MAKKQAKPSSNSSSKKIKLPPVDKKRVENFKDGGRMSKKKKA